MSECSIHGLYNSTFGLDCPICNAGGIKYPNPLAGRSEQEQIDISVGMIECGNFDALHIDPLLVVAKAVRSFKNSKMKWEIEKKKLLDDLHQAAHDAGSMKHSIANLQRKLQRCQDRRNHE